MNNTRRKRSARHGRAGLRVAMVLFAATIAAESFAEATSGQRPLVYFHVGFEGDPAAQASGEVVKPEDVTEADYMESEHSKAIAFAARTTLRYDLPDGFPFEAGSLEFVFRPGFPQEAEEPERTILAIGDDPDSMLTLNYVPVGSTWRFRWPKRLFSQTGHGTVKQDAWQHLVLVWDSTIEPRAEVRLYHNGEGGAVYTYTLSPASMTKLALGGAGPMDVSVDEVAIYSRALTQGQAAFLAKSLPLREDRFEALAARIAGDDREEARRRAERQKQREQLAGKVGRLIHLRGEKARDYMFPEGIEAKGIRPEDVGAVDLSQFRVIYFPQGTAYQLDDEQRQVIFDYVKDGGGYVGSCAGANFASSIRLLDVRRHTFLGRALFPIRLKPHPVTDGYGSQVVMHHGNGPIMFPGDNCRAIGTYPVPADEDNSPGAIIVGKQGKGRVVLFGPHPLGGGIGAAGKSIRLSAEELGTDRMFVNALLYAAGIVDEDNPVSASNDNREVDAPACRN